MFVTLGGLPPRRLVVARELPRCGELREVCEGCASPPQGKKQDSGSEEVVERDPTQGIELKETHAHRVPQRRVGSFVLGVARSGSELRSNKSFVSLAFLSC